jgi:hypothetical protein
MWDRRRYKSTGRGTRAYLAGFGTSGSLVAGAALLFVLASAIVAFRGWPQVGTGPATAALVVPSPRAPSRPNARLVVALRSPVTTGALRPAVLRRARRGGGPGGRSGTGTGVAGGGRPGSPTGISAGPVARGASAGTGSCGGNSCANPGQQNAITSVTSSVSQTVSSAGNEIGTQVGSTAGTVATKLSSASPNAANTVQSTGTTGGSAVSGTGTTAANAISAAGSAPGGVGH